MFIERIERYNQETNRKRIYYAYICDYCNKQFELKIIIRHKYHFCSQRCAFDAQKIGGVLYEQKINNCLEKHGVEHPMKLEETKNKVYDTWEKIYGVRHNWQAPKVREKVEATNIEKYGERYASMTEETKEKAALTCIERYNAISPLQNDDIKQKAVETCRENFNVDYPQQSNEVRDKSKATCLERYGEESYSQTGDFKQQYKQTCLDKYKVEHYSQSDEYKEKYVNTCIDKYGVTNTFQIDEIKQKANSREAHEKAHETMKRNGTYKLRSSKPENDCYTCLCECFKSVERSKLINRWEIDFYLEDIDTYIQFDGVYWHGLDRQLEEIIQFKNKRDKVIYKSYLRDRTQDEWFTQNNLELIRITDKEFIGAIDKIALIKEKLNLK